MMEGLTGLAALPYSNVVPREAHSFTVSDLQHRYPVQLVVAVCADA